MTRSELIVRLAARQHALTAADTSACVGTLLEAIAGHLSAGNRIEIRGFGTLSVGSRAERIGRNPKTGEKVTVPAKRTVRFKAGYELRRRVDRG